MYLYVVKETRVKGSNDRPKMIKVGIARDPDARLKYLQTSNPMVLPMQERLL